MIYIVVWVCFSEFLGSFLANWFYTENGRTARFRAGMDIQYLLTRVVGWASGGCRTVILQPRGGRFCNYEEESFATTRREQNGGNLGDFESG